MYGNRRMPPARGAFMVVGVSIMRDVLPADRIATATAVRYGSFGVGGSLGRPVAAPCALAIGVGCAPGTLPTLIMDAVPVSGTAVTVGLNTLTRSIGTSVSSAVAGVIPHHTIDFDGVTLPLRNGPRTVLAIGGCRRRLPGLRALHLPPAVGCQLRGSTRACGHGRGKGRH
ncbi:hypothetical protein AB0P17_23070 [Streptomyces sp. NPDC088124]|uniref:hypothetical protein n=1 Tax=Streptomyces sp. NPDC088124 TaxID=3154654 RepID=UPI003437FD56